MRWTRFLLLLTVCGNGLPFAGCAAPPTIDDAAPPVQTRSTNESGFERISGNHWGWSATARDIEDNLGFH